VSVKVGQIVAAGQVIGKSGDTGYSQCLPHLHFARQHQGKGVTQSVPMYFQGYETQELHDGDVLRVPPSPCTPPSANADATTQNVDPQAQPNLGSFCGEYFGGALDQPVAFVRRDSWLNFDWSSTGPGGYWLDDASAAYSARWTGSFAFTSAGLYTIGVIWSGAIVVSIDGAPVVDRWVEQDQPAEVILSKALGTGIHRIDVQYMTTNGHGMLKLGWGRLDAE